MPSRPAFAASPRHAPFAGMAVVFPRQSGLGFIETGTKKVPYKQKKPPVKIKLILTGGFF